MKVLVLAGGLGTRMREETEFKPKPMVEIGGIPLLVHLMRVFALQGHHDFVVCTGYRTEMIESFFSDQQWRAWCDRKIPEWRAEEWRITTVDTGIETPTGGRIALARDLLGDERFFCTYGDGLAPVDLRTLEEQHQLSACAATVTLAHPTSRFGVAELGPNGKVNGFREKPVLADLVSVGFFVFESRVFEYLRPDSVLEEGPLSQLAAEGELAGHVHHGFWQPIDTYRELLAMQQLWKSGSPPWLPLPNSRDGDAGNEG